MRIPRVFRAHLALAAILVAAGYLNASDEESSGDSHSAAAAHKANQDDTVARSEYILKPFDVLKIEVFQEPDLERQVRVSQDSTVTLPLIGTIDLKGRTVQEASEIIRNLYNRDYLVNPQINLIVVEYAKHVVSVLGQVEKAGAIEIPANKPLLIVDALAQAGGFTRLADRKHVTLTRQDSNGATVTQEVNIDNILGSKEQSSNWVLKEGDVVFVPERLL